MFVAAPRDALVGHRAPSVAFDLLDGTRVDLAALLGRKPIYLKFWATWCVPCREQMPHLMETWRAHRDRLAVFAVDVGINDPIENVRELVAALSLTLPIAIDHDGTVSERFHLNVTPQHVVIDRAGIVRHVGHAITPELERAIAEVVAETDPVPDLPLASASAVPDVIPQPLALDDGTTLPFALHPEAPLVLTFATLWCDSYIAKSRPAMGIACAAHAKQVERLQHTHPDLAWVTVAYPVWTDVENIESYRKRLGVSSRIGIDRDAAWFRRFRVRDVYTTIVLDASGTELGRIGGDGVGLAMLLDRLSDSVSRSQ